MIKTSLGFPVATNEELDIIEKTIETAKAEGGEYKRVHLVNDVEIINKSETEESGTIVVTASDESVDIDREIILQKGIDLTQYRKNMLVCWNHDYEQLPIGQGRWVKVVDGALKEKIKFADRPADYPAGSWFPETVWNMVKQGVIKAVSVGIIGTKFRAPTDNEIKKNPSWADARRIVEKSMMVELSVCQTGANNNALVEVINKSLASREDIAALGLDYPEVDMGWTWTSEDLVIPVPVDPRLAFLKSIQKKK